MPVECAVTLTVTGQDRFHEVDRVIMGHAFDIHNELGRFFDESIYQNELCVRCGQTGIEARCEVEIQVSHKDFKKSYFIDMLIESSFIYELKVAVDLANANQQQVINYLLLTDLKHGKLLNFRPSSLQSRFVSTRLCRGQRKTFQINDQLTGINDDPIYLLKETLCALLADWGAFLEISLYREALLFLMSDMSANIQEVNIISNGRVIGSQKMCMLSPISAWHLSASSHHLPTYETHIRRLLNHTPLQAIHWINFNHHQITLKTLQK